MRIETDLLGQKYIEESCLYGINTLRALENFPVSGRGVHRSLMEAMVEVKKAAAQANQRVKLLDNERAGAIVRACDRLLGDPQHPAWSAFVTDALQGGAGTSTNMNVNEVLANLANLELGASPGDYDHIHPLNHVNMSQSTNDVYPTALRLAAVRWTRRLSEELARLQEALQQKENQFSHVLKLGRTQLMDALPMTVGQEFGAWAKAIARDRWRIYKVEERLREINIGGTAIGTGLNAPLEYTYTVTALLQQNTGLGLSRSDYLVDTTQNMDVFVEVSGLMKALAVNLIKISSDIRLLGSGPSGGLGELKLPQVQAGSTIMPGKVNPVICEMAAQVGMKVIGHDGCITQAAMMGQLELNAFGPLIADSLLDSYEMLTKACRIFRERAIEEMDVDEAACLEKVERSSAMATALVQHLGYDEGSRLAKKAQTLQKTIREVVLEEGLYTPEDVEKILNVYQVTSPGIPGKELLK